MSYYDRHKDSGWKELIIGIILVLVITMASESCSRAEANMIYIGNGYCYHEYSGIIYIESSSDRYGRKSYTVYYDKDGNKAKYNIETGEWEVVIVQEAINGNSPDNIN